MRVRFVYRRAVEPELRRERGVRERVTDAAEEVASAAKSYAPVRTGVYRDSIVTESELTDEGYVARTRATAPYAAFIEFGTNDTQAYAPLQRGLDAVTR